MYPNEYLYSEDHEWVYVENDEGLVGITDYAQNELGEVVYVDLPEVGETFDAGEEIGAIESSKAVAEVYAPVSGKVIEVNEGLEDAPEMVNEDAHGDGWLVKLHLTSPDELEGLMSAEQYQEFLSGQD